MNKYAKYCIKLSNVDESKRVQEKAFNLGYEWPCYKSERNIFKHVFPFYIFLDGDGNRITWSSCNKDGSYIEIDAGSFMKLMEEGETETEYYSRFELLDL